MVESSRVAITAIAHVDQEGFIAATLHRLGWKVIHRATSDSGLSEALTSHPDALLISSTDFRGAKELTFSRHIRLAKIQKNVMSEAELQDLLREVDHPSESAFTRLPPTQSRLTLLASVGRSVGTSTVALNLAQELAEHTSDALYLDCNNSHPYISQQLGINGVNRGIQRTQFGFSVGEITGSDSLQALASTANSYSHLLLDYGQLISVEQSMRGKRLSEQLFTWAVQSQCDLILVSKAENRNLDEVANILAESRSVIPAIDPLVLLTLTSVLSGRERSRLGKDLSDRLGAEVRLISRDRKATIQMEEENSTLSAGAPKSLLRSEIRALAEERLIDRDVQRA